MIGVSVFLLCAVGCGVMLCRVARMSQETLDQVAWQHYALGLGFAAVPVVWYLGGQQEGPAWALLTLAASTLAYVLMEPMRRRHTKAAVRGDDGGSQDQRGLDTHRPAWKRMHQDGSSRDGGLLRASSMHTGRAGPEGSIRS